MPKPLWEWLYYNALKWQMDGTALRIHHGGTWHRFQGEPPGWADCGTWVASNNWRDFRGKGKRFRNPWSRSVGIASLCALCFADEIPVLKEIKARFDAYHWSITASKNLAAEND